MNKLQNKAEVIDEEIRKEDEYERNVLRLREMNANLTNENQRLKKEIQRLKNIISQKEEEIREKNKEIEKLKVSFWIQKSGRRY